MQPTDYYYGPVQWLASQGVISGYGDCTFRPIDNTTRGQMTKIIARGLGWSTVETNTYTFADVPPSQTFYPFVEAVYAHGIVSGYPCGGLGELCDPQSRPYFRVSSNVTRGRLTHIVANALGWNEQVTGQTFEDVPPGSTFYNFVERTAVRGIVNGYPCGGVGRACVAPRNRPYYRPNGNSTRGQIAKILYLALTQ